MMTQHRDTVRYIRGCAAVGHADTTVFLLFARDSVKRLSTDPRMFGEAMVLSLVGHMRSALLQQSNASRSPDVVRALPKLPEQCMPAR
jgi:hypothetical protein